MFTLGIAVFFTGLFFIVWVSSHYDPRMAIYILFDLPTTFFFITTITAVIVATGNFKTFIAAINALLSKKYNISAADKEKSIRLFKLLGKSVVSAAVLLTVVGLTLMLMDLSDPAYLGPRISIALCAISQGVCINLILIYPAINVLQARYIAEEKRVISEKQVIDKLLELCYRQGITPEEILDAREISFRKQ